MLGPTGIGVVWGKKELLNKNCALSFGGMIDEVSFTSSTWAALQKSFEASTPNIGWCIGLAAAINYLSQIGMENIRANEKEL